ncbi:MAG: EAL domain-containing protein [Rubrivivax sp.]|nr:EAL domain-containing protein [Rubrivivax sp.]
MSLTPRVVLWLVGVWLLVAAFALGVAAWLAGDAQARLWAERNRAEAAASATALARLPAEGDSRRQWLATRFARGDLQLLALRGAPHATLVEHRRDAASAAPGDVPAWFAALLPTAAEAAAPLPAPVASAEAAPLAPLAPSGAAGPGGADVPSVPAEATAAAPAAPAAAGIGPSPTLRVDVLVQARAADLQRLAWQVVRGVALACAAATLLVVAALVWLGRRWQRSLRAAVAQAQGLAQLQFVEAPEPRWPELGQLTRALNAVVRRLREQVAAQAEQVAALQRQAQTDAVSGLPLRGFFVSRLADLLADARLPAASLLLVRIPDLAGLNERHGREVADRLLAAVADVLLTYVERIPGAAAGRLAGADFALALPAAGAARETAAAIQAALAAAPAARLPGVRVVVGGCDGLRGLSASAALAAADSALARAEAGEDCVVEDRPEPGTTGARAWRELLAAALDESHVRLGAFPVVDAQGRLIHLECPLRVQVERGGEFLVARRWLAMAARSRLMPMVDLSAVNLALAAIAEDAQPRCVHVSPRSLASPGFARALLARLKAGGAHAARLSIEWSDLPDAATGAALREAVPAWRRLGVRVGVEHAGASPRSLPALKEIGIDYVKVDARHLLGVTDDEAARSYVESLVALIHGLGLHALAEGVADARQLEVLWTLGFDGATGSAVGLGEAGDVLSGRVEEGA